ncbi:uncharacterized protein J7T54_004775 [Emericellopsis cladophorae]|uniref:Uncharacterized protein n=1 Tax=Emericellopsis cladophorae TaxID=2686198 RepID=A0A9P9Y7C9_9HYPO|nr:uncharacterized protein J7T54_004775 [Emericellopsis cladophorae]KAI6784229.1 hypothetical protein J7T54_004775 [Emericellopsis cladophorae]
MTVSHAVQPIISAFSFGIITNGAAAAAVVFLRTSASSLFHDSQRLVLTTFLISAALWALIAFIGLAIDTPSGCQVAIVFTTAFDQIARTAFVQFLLWAMTGGSKRSWTKFIPQALVVLRFVLGSVYVGFQRPQFAPVCFSSTRVLPLGASILGVDAIVLSILLITFRTGSSNGNGCLQVNADRAKVLVLGVAAAAFWTVLSGPMLLGIRSLDLLLRTVLPCIGLIVLISMTMLARSQLLANSDEEGKLYPNLNDTRQYRMSALVRDMANRPSLQMSVAPRDSKVSKRETQSVRVTALNKPPNRNKALPGINGPVPGQVETGIGGLPVAGQLFPPTRSGNPVDSRYNQPQGPGASGSTHSTTQITAIWCFIFSGDCRAMDLTNSRLRCAIRHPNTSRPGAGKADVWDLLAVPNGETPVVPPRSPLRQQQQPWTSPAAKAIAMPTAPSERQRSRPRQSRASLSEDLKIDTSSRLPPVSNNNKDSYAFAQQGRSEAPPPYQIDYQAHGSPKTPALEAFVAPPAIVETRSSPRLSLFPPPPTKRAISPRQDSPTTMDVSLAPGKPVTYKGLEALPHTDGTFTTQTVMLLDDVEYRDSIMTTSIVSRKSSPIRGLLGKTDLTGPSEQDARIEEPPATNTLEIVALETSPVPSLRGTATPDEELSETSSFDTGVAESPFLGQFSPPITSRQHDFSPPESPAKMTASKTMLDNDMWRRLGAPCPTFSNRPAFSRRQPPPEPLPLYRSVNGVVVETEPSPLESPDHALREIEAQLQKLERSSRVSSVGQMQRMTLLAELEQEIDGQETQWQAMRHTIIRDSLSTVSVSPQRTKEVASLWAKVRRDRNSHLTVDTCLSARSASPEPLRRLAVPGSRMSHLALSPLQLGSPTPPDTDSDMGDEIPVMLAEAVQLARRPAVSLWRAEAASPHMFKYTACLWSPSQDRSLVLPKTLPVSTERPTRRYREPPLEIDSQQLWTKGKKYTPIRRGGLWKPTSPAASTTSPSAAATTSIPALAPLKRSASLPSRPSLAVKPIRKSKRISALPDIVESPRLHPVRHTLGLFSFPWGETSDSAYPALYQNAIPGTMSTGLERVFDFPTAAPQDDAQRTFFEECDEEDYGDNFEDMDDYDGFGSDDDEVDQEMLWEIAGMLKSEEFHLVPSGVQLPSQWPREALESNAHVQGAIDEAISEQMVAPTAKAELWQPASHLFKISTCALWLLEQDRVSSPDWIVRHTAKPNTPPSKLWRRVGQLAKLKSASDGLWLPHAFPPPEEEYTLQPRSNRRPTVTRAPLELLSDQAPCTLWRPEQEKVNRPDWIVRHTAKSKTPSSKLWSRVDRPAKSLSDGLWLAHALPSHEEEYTLQPRSSRRPAMVQASLALSSDQVFSTLWLPEKQKVTRRPDWMVRHIAKPNHTQPEPASVSKLWRKINQPATPSSDELWLRHALPPLEDKYTLQPRSSHRPVRTHTPMETFSEQASCTLWLPEQQKATTRPDWMARHTAKFNYSQPEQALLSKLWSRVDQPAKLPSDRLWLPHVLPSQEEVYTLQPRSNRRRPAMTHAPMEDFDDQATRTLWRPQQQVARPDWMARHITKSNHSQPSHAQRAKLWRRFSQPQAAKASSDGLWLPQALPSLEEEYVLQPQSSHRRPAMAKAPMAHFSNQGLWTSIGCSGEMTRGWLI